MEEKEISEKESRIRAITKLYYSNPKVQETMIKFSKDREVIPRYFEGFGKRPDTISYVSDLTGLVKKGATSFHASEELWNDPLKLDSNSPQEEINEFRKGWDLFLDIDSPFLDCSKIAAKLIVAALEKHGIKNYGMKFSGNRGFHIIVSWKAFPEEYGGEKTREMFPEWPRAICEYLMSYIRKDYNAAVGDILTDFKTIEERANLSKEDLVSFYCMKCNKPARKGEIVKLKCNFCNLEIERKNVKLPKRKLKCLNNDCPGNFDVVDEREYYYCENCFDPDNEKLPLDSDKYPELFEEVKGVNAEKVAGLDLVLVAPRHLFRMPYSLNEKTSLASIVIAKEEIDSFSPKDANPFNIKIKEFYPNNYEGEAKRLLIAALDWKRQTKSVQEKIDKKKYEFDNINVKNVSEELFPYAIKKLLLGLEDGRKRGLFVLITFLRSLNFSSEYINAKIREWNNLNKPPLKEGYVKSQIDWHLKQKKKILPPNYSNDAFYKDIGIIDEKPREKNPIVEVLRKVRKR